MSDTRATGDAPPTVPRSPDLRAMVESIALGSVVDDAQLDRIYPPDVRASSKVHWTPFRVVARALQMLRVDENTHVLDVGAGAGKFCLLGALLSRGRFHGVEQRRPLVELSRAIAFEYAVERVTYVHAEAAQLDWSGWNALYLYNPFGEYFLEDENRIAAEAPFSRRRYQHLLRATLSRLYLAPVGTRVVTYHGIGAPMPPGYRRLEVDAPGDGLLESWIREDPERTTSRKDFAEITAGGACLDCLMRVGRRPQGYREL